MSYNPCKIRLNGKLRKLGGTGHGKEESHEGMRVAGGKVGVAKVWGGENSWDMAKLCRGGGKTFRDMKECVA